MIAAAFDAKQKLLALSAILAILGSALWIYRTEFRLPGINVPLQESVGQVMAEETSRLMGHSGDLVIVTADTSSSPELKVQIEAFEKQLKRLGGITIAERVALDPGDDSKYRPGAGLSAKRFLKIVRKHHRAGAIVSFVGAPHLSDAELEQVKSAPKFIAETHSPEKLANLFEKKVLLAAVVPRYEFPAPGPRKPRTQREWFERYFQVLAPGKDLPKQDELP
jgi:hypothetical protein